MSNKIVEHIKGNKNLLNGSLFSLYSFFGQGVNFILLIVLAKFILPSEYGNLGLFSTVTEVLGLLLGVSTGGYISIVYFRESAEDFKKDFTAIFNVHIITFLFYNIVLLIGGSIISKALSLPLDTLYMAGFIVFFNKCFFLQQNLHRLKEEIKVYGIISCGNALFNFVSAIFFVVYLNLNWIGRIYSMLTCTALFAIISIIYFHKQRLFFFRNIKNRYIPIIMWSLPLIPHLAANWIKQGLDRYIINFNYSSYEVGIFSFALNLTSVIVSIGIAFNNSNSVSLYKTLSADISNDEKLNETNKSIKEYLYIYIILSVLVIIGGALLTPCFFPQYSKSVPYFIILGFYGFLQCVYFLYCNFFFYYKRNRELMFITFGTSILHLLLSLILTRYSLYFTAFVYLLSMIVVDYLVIVRSKKMMKAYIEN